MLPAPDAPDFWAILSNWMATNDLVIDRPAGSAHPRFPSIIYPFDYGYLAGTQAGDGEGVDVWCGSVEADAMIAGVVLTLDPMKRDAEIKILLNCTADDVAQIMTFLRDNHMGALFVRAPMLSE